MTVIIPRFTTTTRNGKVAMWVTMPDGSEWNIWDLSENIFHQSKEAILNAFRLGYEAERRVKKPELYLPVLSVFEVDK